ncbi:hypothetical protein NL676_024305 [Syzygium grande]|nr:hypothetical protein NL676_024305 [Syzygium grande]
MPAQLLVITWQGVGPSPAESEPSVALTLPLLDLSTSSVATCPHRRWRPSLIGAVANANMSCFPGGGGARYHRISEMDGEDVGMP